MNQPRVQEILDFWFGGLTDADRIYQGHPVARYWFNPNDDFDRQIRERFESDVEAAAEGTYETWINDPHGRLALIILTDQFSRNLYRNTPRMYATDAMALELSQRCLSGGADRKLMLVERLFVYMPFMHSEDLSVQKFSLKCFEQLAAESKRICPQNTHYYANTLKYAQKHHDDIARDGRFVYRDKILQR